MKIFAGNHTIGLVGLAGSKYKSRYFSGWYSKIKSLDCANIVHRDSHGSHKVFLSPDENACQQEVVCIDGVFMCCKKEAWQKVAFNEKDLKGFHFYDIDFSLRASALFTVIVTYEIDLVHITSGGDYGNSWVRIAIDFHALHRNRLPYTILENIPANVDDLIIHTWLDRLKNVNISLKNKLQWILMQKLHLKARYHYSILKFLTYHPLRLKRLHDMFKK
jgi:hypothetical protein